MNLRLNAQRDFLKTSLLEKREQFLTNQSVSAKPLLQHGKLFPQSLKARAFGVKHVDKDIVLLDKYFSVGFQYPVHLFKSLKRVAEVLQNVAAIHYIEMVVFELQRMSITLSEMKVRQGSLNESQLLTGIFHANDFSL